MIITEARLRQVVLEEVHMRLVEELVEEELGWLLRIGAAKAELLSSSHGASVTRGHRIITKAAEATRNAKVDVITE